MHICIYVYMCVYIYMYSYIYIYIYIYLLESLCARFMACRLSFSPPFYHTECLSEAEEFQDFKPRQDQKKILEETNKKKDAIRCVCLLSKCALQ